MQPNDLLREDGQHNLINADGAVIVECAKRQPCEVYSRVVGYLRPVNLWNKGKRAEWADRATFVANTKVISSKGESVPV